MCNSASCQEGRSYSVPDLLDAIVRQTTSLIYGGMLPTFLRKPDSSTIQSCSMPSADGLSTGRQRIAFALNWYSAHSIRLPSSEIQTRRITTLIKAPSTRQSTLVGAVLPKAPGPRLNRAGTVTWAYVCESFSTRPNVC